VIAVVDVDDLICVEQIEDLLVPIKKKIPAFKVTAYTVPNKFGTVTPALRARYPWIVFGIHGWEHTPFECLTWSDSDADRNIMRALAMGYDYIFKAPNWEIHDEVVQACGFAKVTVHHHDRRVPAVAGASLFPGPLPRDRRFTSIHTHILKNPVTDYIEDHPAFLPENLLAWEDFATPFDFARHM